MSWLRIFKHLLPRAKAWELTVDKLLRQFFDGLTELPSNTKDFIDAVWEDIFPQTTNELAAWENQFGLPNTSLTEQERKDRLEATWAAQGGQSPRYIEDTLQAAGFPVYVHEWWSAVGPPPVARDPGAVGLTDWLVNKIDIVSYNYTGLCGELLAACGEDWAQCGEYDGFFLDRVDYELPTDPNYFPYFLYIGDAVFGDTVTISLTRKGEFEDLLLKICPAHLWIGLFIEYTGLIVEDLTGAFVLDDETGAYLTGA